MVFGAYLEKLVYDSDWSINQLTKQCGVNRGGLYSVFKSQRKLTDEQLFALISKLNLSPAKEAKLTDMYFDDYYGKLEHSKIKYAIEQIKDCVPAAAYANGDLKGAPIDALKSFLSQNQRVVTNFPYAFADADRLFFAAVRAGTVTEFTHIFALDNQDDYQNNYSSIFKSLKYMYFGHFPKWYYASVKALHDAALFPYFAVGEKTAVLFSETAAVTLTNAQAVQTVAGEAAKLLEACETFGEKIEDILQVKDEYQRGLAGESLAMTLTSYPCLAKFADHETMQSIVRQNLPNKEMLVEIAYSHYSAMYRRIRQIQITTEEGIQRFASTGNFREVSAQYIDCADVRHRIKVLEKVLEAVAAEEVYLLNKDKLALPDGFMMENYASQTILYLFDAQNENGDMYERFFAQFKDRSFVSALNQTMEYLIKSRKVYPKEYTLQFVENIIAGLKTLV